MCKEEREKLQKGDKIFCLECGTELVTIDKIYNTGITIIRSWRNWTGEYCDSEFIKNERLLTNEWVTDIT